MQTSPILHLTVRETEASENMGASQRTQGTVDPQAKASPSQSWPGSGRLSHGSPPQTRIPYHWFLDDFLILRLQELEDRGREQVLRGGELLSAPCSLEQASPGAAGPERQPTKAEGQQEHCSRKQ